MQELVKRLKLDQLQAVLVDEGRRVREEVLGRLRDSLRGELDRIDAKIEALSGGKRRGGRRKKGPGPKRKDGTFKDALVRVFQKAGSALHVNDLADRVKTVGFRSTATARNLTIQAYRALKDKTLFRKLGRGKYALKG